MNCFHCKVDINKYDIFCHNCGRELINKCRNNNCEYAYISLESTDKYCRLCGSETIFKEKGYIGIEESNEEYEDYLRAVNNNDPIDYDDIPF